MSQQLLVSVGVPVRNGAPFLDEALTLLRLQTHAHLEIIVSDNASDDVSPQIIRRHAAEDSRIRVYRHDVPLTALANFRFVFEHARGEYFMWAACDDRRSLDHVEYMLAALREQSSAVLAFGAVAEVGDLGKWSEAPAMPYEFESTPGESPSIRLRRYTRINCLHIYGLIRRSALLGYAWIEIDSGPDIPLLVHLACLGEFVRAEGGCFYYYVPPRPKTLQERAIANSLRRLQLFPELRLSWACAEAAHRAGRMSGRPIGRLPAFAMVYANRHWGWIKPRLFEMFPDFVVELYRRWFKRGPG